MDLFGVPKKMNILNCCRVCMKTDCSLLSLFHHTVTNQGVIQLAEVLMKCAEIKVSQEDGLPQNICADCGKTLESIFELRMRALVSEVELRKLVESSLNGEENSIKTEMKLEEDEIDMIGNEELFMEDLSHYCLLNSPKQENLDNVDQQHEVYKCEQCSKQYSKKHKFLKHLKSHESRMYCDICKKVFYSKKLLNKHIKKHHSKCTCYICDQDFATEGLLFQHIVNHTNDVNVKCPKCDVIFSRRNPFSYHLKKFHKSTECTIYNKVFTTKSHLKSLMKQDSKGKYRCSECPKTYIRPSLFLQHMNSHKSVKKEQDTHTNDEIDGTCDSEPKSNDITGLYKCDICDNSFMHESQLQEHMKLHDEVKNEAETCSNDDNHETCEDSFQNIYNKNICSNEFSSKHLLNRHSDIVSIYKCNKCDNSFMHQSQLLEHMKIHDEVKNEEETFSNDDNYETCEDSLKIICDICSKEFSSKPLLNRHMKLHSDDKPYECKRCSKRYSRRDHLVQHMKWHDGVKPYICTYCSKAFNQLCSLKDHIRTHTGETPYLCSECGKSFANNSNLRQHVMRHSGVKQFKCSLCPKSFVTKGQMVAHVTTHTGAHPYKCEECGSSFTKPNSLKKHMNIHLGVKPFGCETCNMRFSCKEHLKRHTRIHTGEKPYACSYCDRAFTQSNDLAKHIRTHVGQNIYQCSVCSLRFRLLSELKQHYPTHYVTGDEVPKIEISKGVEAPVLILKPQEQEQEQEPPPEMKHEPRITITINSNGLDKNGLAGDITINLSPEKS